MVHFTKKNIITPDMQAECGSQYWDEITEWLGLVTCPDCIAAQQSMHPTLLDFELKRVVCPHCGVAQSVEFPAPQSG